MVPLKPGAVSLAPPNWVHLWCGSVLASLKPLTSGTPFTGPGPAAGFGFLAFVGAGFSVNGLIVGEIGRASCRERVSVSVVAVPLRRKGYEETVVEGAA